MTKNGTALAVIAAGLLAASAAHAQNGPVVAACSQEIQKYCANIPHAQGAVRRCLEQNIGAVSTGCKSAIESTGPGKGAGTGNPK